MKLLTIAFLLIFTNLVFAQESKKSVLIEPKIGMAISNLIGSETDNLDKLGVEYNSKKAITFGIGIRKQLSNSIYLKSGVNYSRLGTKFDDDLLLSFEAGFFRIPVLLGISTKDNSASFEAGLSANLLNNRTIISIRGENKWLTSSLLLGLVFRHQMRNKDWIWISPRFFSDLGKYYLLENANGERTGTWLSFQGLELTIGLSI